MSSFALLAACGRGANQTLPAAASVAPGQAPASQASGLDDSYCPFSVIVLGPWSHELFPGCAPLGYWESDPICAGGGCGMPCARQTTRLPDAVSDPLERLAYDANGRLVSSTRGTVVDETYTYDGDHLEMCDLGNDGRYTSKRDVSGRLTRTCYGDNCSTIIWRADGLLGEITGVGGDLRFTYDDAQRVTGDGHFVFARDARGRIIRAHFPGGDGTVLGGDMVFAYVGDHLGSVDGPYGAHTEMTYDQSGRIVTLTRGSLKNGGVMKHARSDFSYSCQ